MFIKPFFNAITHVSARDALILVGYKKRSPELDSQIRDEMLSRGLVVVKKFCTEDHVPAPFNSPKIAVLQLAYADALPGGCEIVEDAWDTPNCGAEEELQLVHPF